MRVQGHHCVLFGKIFPGDGEECSSDLINLVIESQYQHLSAAMRMEREASVLIGRHCFFGFV
jgi:hypothetical protein